jgi:hypothetical protein
MDAHKISELQAWVVVAVKNGRLVSTINIPIRWAVIIVGTIATTVGYPTFASMVIKLLHAD